MLAVSLGQFQAYLGTDETGDFIESCLTASTSNVEAYIGEILTVPSEIVRQAILICGSELFHRRSAPNGIAQFASMDGAPVRVARDPMTSVYPLLQRYLGYSV